MATRSVILLAVVAVLLGCFTTIGSDARSILQAATLTPENLRCEYLVNPLGIDETQPRLSWVSRSSGRAKAQSAYRVLVAGDPKQLEKDTGDLWDSGKVMSAQSIQVVYEGTPLKSQTRCYWKVRVWDETGAPSMWSKPAYWTMGLLNPDDWKAKWIAFDASRKRPEGVQKLDLSKAKWIWSSEGAAAGAPIGTRYFRAEFVLTQGRQVVSAI